MEQIESSVRDEIEGIVREPDIEQKLKAAAHLCARRSRLKTFHGDGDGPIDSQPGRPKDWRVLSVANQPRRAKLSKPEGRLQLMHSLAHIELCAVELALLSVSDFPGQPIEYYRDMMRIAAEEIAHTQMLRRRLEELGGALGSEPVHFALWETTVQAQELSERLVVVPRILEAKGLDVSHALRSELRRAGDVKSADSLDIIYQDEIGHVSLGTRWYRWVCERNHWDPEQAYIAALNRWMKGRIPTPDREGRLKAGFTEREVDALEERARQSRMRPKPRS